MVIDDHFLANDDVKWRSDNCLFAIIAYCHV